MRTMSGVLVALALLAGSTASAQTAQQERVRSCYTQARESNVPEKERKAFIWKCVRPPRTHVTAPAAAPAAAAPGDGAASHEG